MGNNDDPSGVPEMRDPLLMLERMDEAFYAIDSDWHFLFVNAAAERFWNRRKEDLLGRTMFEVFTQFGGSPSHAAHRLAMETGAPHRLETYSTATGAPVELRLFPSEGGISVYFHDITRRRQMEQDLATREELLTLAELSAGIGAWAADLRDGTFRATPQYYRLLGLDPVDGPVSQDISAALRHPDDRDRVAEGFRDAVASGADAYEAEYRIIRPTGEERWIFGRGRVTRDAGGRPWRYSGVDIDITARKQQEEHMRTVMRELLHRTNNMLAVVQGLARQTASRSDSIPDFTTSFNARLRGLSESNMLLAREDWRGARLDQLLHGQTAPFADDRRFLLDGPPVLLTPRAVQNLGLAFHELCTNAVKYGALSVPQGTVRVAWSVVEHRGEPWLRITWQESGGPPVAPPTRSGFGRVVTERTIAATLDAVVETRFDPTGVIWTIDLPPAEFTLRLP